MCPFIGFANAVFFWNRVDSPPTNSISLTLLHITSRTWSRPRRRRGWRPLGTVAVLSSRHYDLNDCLDVALDVLLPWRSGCSLTKQLLTFCLLHPCSIALSTHQLHHQVFPASNLNALPVPNAKQVCSRSNYVLKLLFFSNDVCIFLMFLCLTIFKNYFCILHFIF